MGNIKGRLKFQTAFLIFDITGKLPYPERHTNPISNPK